MHEHTWTGNHIISNNVHVYSRNVIFMTWMHSISITHLHASRSDRSEPIAAVHARSCPLQRAWTWYSYGQRYIRLVQMCGSFEVSRKAFTYHTIAALLVSFLFENFPSSLVGPWLPVPDSYWAGGTVSSRIEMVQILSNFFQDYDMDTGYIVSSLMWCTRAL